MTVCMAMPFDKTTKASSMKERVDKLGFIKIKRFYSIKDEFKRVRRQVKNRENIFVIDMSDKEVEPKIYKELLKLSNNNLF